MITKISLPNRIEENLVSFDEYLKDNYEVYHLFAKFSAQLVKNQKRTCYGANCVIERIRWDMDYTVAGTFQFKINSKHVAFFSRLYDTITSWNGPLFYKRSLLSGLWQDQETHDVALDLGLDWWNEELASGVEAKKTAYERLVEREVNMRLLSIFTNRCVK